MKAILSMVLGLLAIAVIAGMVYAAEVPLPPSPEEFLEPIEKLLEGAPKVVLPPPPDIKFVPLPSIILVPGRHIYKHRDHYYYYWGGVWYFGPSPDGPWYKLPKKFYPKKYKRSGPKHMPPGHMPKEPHRGRGK